MSDTGDTISSTAAACTCHRPPGRRQRGEDEWINVTGSDSARTSTYPVPPIDMPIYPIRTFGDPVLRLETKPITEITDSVRTLAEDMIETMYD
ncbi:MAG: peptide deformylase, partial [Acidimicrobiia bacterium]